MITNNLYNNLPSKTASQYYEERDNSFYLTQIATNYNEGEIFTIETPIVCRALAFDIKAGTKIIVNGVNLEISADAAQSATQFFITATTLETALEFDSIVSIDQKNLFLQYQDKTEGTVAGFDIDADRISKGGVEITGWLDSDTMEGATANNVPTAESVKAYVDGQVGHSETLQEVTDNGNTTTNDITGASLTLGDGTTSEFAKVFYSDGTYTKILGYGLEMSRSTSYIRPTVTDTNALRLGTSSLNWTNINYYAIRHTFYNASSELMTLTSTGLGIGTSSPISKTEIKSSGANGLVLSEDINNSTLSSRLFLTNGTSGQGIALLNASGNLQFLTGSIPNNTSGSEKMRITSAGNVGIATSSPEVKLDVRGQLLVAGDTPVSRIGSTLEVYRNGSTAELSIHQDDSSASSTFSQLRFRNGGNDTYLKVPTSGNGLIIDVESKSNAFVIDTSGNVGIGTTSPGTKLHVGTGSGATVDTGYQIVADSPGIAGIQILAANNQSSRVIFGDADDNDIGMIKYDHTDNSMGFRTNGSGNERMRITSDGNVGIGTTSPSRKLDVVGDVKVHNTGSGNNATLFIDTVSGGNADSILNFREATVDRASLYWDGGDNDLYLTTTTGDFLINPSGSVGIGTTSPTSPLHIDGGTNGEVLKIESNSAPYIRFIGGGVNKGFLQFTNTTAYLSNQANGDFNFRTNNTDKLIIKSAGNVLIGTTTDSGYKLDVNGTQRVQDVLELDDVLTLNAISTPDDPDEGKSSIYMDSADGAIKVKINFEGEVVTRTIASFDG